MQDKLEKALLWFWDLIDISENLQRMSTIVRKQPNEPLVNMFIGLAYVAVGIVAFNFALTFDFQSTWNALETTRQFQSGQLTPSNIESYEMIPITIRTITFSNLSLLLITIAPTLVEIFGAAAAKGGIKIMQLLVIGLSIFDAITDVPYVTAFIMLHAASIDALGWLAWPAYIVAFFLWLLLATFGFELVVVLMAWGGVASFLRAVDNNPRGKYPLPKLDRMPETRREATAEKKE